MGPVCVKLYRLEALARAKPAQAFSGEGGLHFAGRWNSRGTRMVYTSSSAALACLETLVHMQALPVPAERWLFTVDVPDEFVDTLPSPPKGWDVEPAGPVSRTAGDAWVAAARSVVLLVPSTVVPLEQNALLNPRHPQFKLSWVGKPQRFRYDPRLK